MCVCVMGSASSCTHVSYTAHQIWKLWSSRILWRQTDETEVRQKWDSVFISHQAAADVHQATFKTSAIVGWEKQITRNIRAHLHSFVFKSISHPSVISYHKHPSTGGSCITAGHRVTHRLIVVRLLAFVQRVVIESVEECGVHLTEEHPNLHMKKRREEVRHRHTYTRLMMCRDVCVTLTLFQWSFWLDMMRKPPSSIR